MRVTDLELEGLKLVELPVYKDERGFFMERYHQARFDEHGIPGAGGRFVQDNHSRSFPGVLRGMHYQFDQHGTGRGGQGKLVGVIKGRIWDVVIDIRADSPTFGKHIGVELKDDGRFLWVPSGFAHGFCVLGDEVADVFYKVDRLYNPKNEGGLCYSDPDLGIRWPLEAPRVAQRDLQFPAFAEYRSQPAFR